MHEKIPAKTGYRIVIRFALSTDTDYVKVFRNYKNLGNSEIIGQQFGIKANTWYELEINPIDYGLYVDFKDIAFLYRDSGETILYIDEIYLIPYPFVDSDIEENVIADFDEEGYLYYVYDNIFKNPTTDHGKRVWGSDFSLVDAVDAPETNDTSKSAPGLGASGKVLKTVVTDKWMGLNYFFPEKINIKDNLTIALRAYIDKRPNAIVIGFFDGNGYDLGKTVWISNTMKVGEWFDWTFPCEALKDFTKTDEISGIYLQFTFADKAEMKNTIYIDKIFVVPQNEISEQQGTTIASFESGQSLTNVFQNLTKSTAEIGWQATDGEANGVLTVKSNNSYDGFSYYFDEPLFITNENIIIKTRIHRDSTIKRVVIYGIADTRTDVVVAECYAKDFPATEYINLIVLARDIMAKISSGEILGLRCEIITAGSSENNILYCDGISLFDASSDTSAPTINGVEVTPVNVLAGQFVDLSALNVNIVDDLDPRPTWILVKVEDGSGHIVSSEDSVAEYKFMPTKSGIYSIYIKAVDWVGNESSSVKVNINITVMESKKDWYLEALNFNSVTDISLVDLSYTKSGVSYPSIVSDGDRTVLSAAFGAKAKGGYTSVLAINIGGLYKASEIGSVVITLRVPEIVGAAGNTWYKAGANVTKATSSAEISIKAAMVSNGSGQPKATTDYITITITGEDLVAALGSEETVVNNIALWNTVSGGEEQPVSVYIDNIEIKEKAEEPEPITDYAEALQFNENKSLQLVEFSYEKGDFASPTIVEDGERTVLYATLGAKAKGGYTSVLAINIGGLYKASEIGSVVITLRVPEIVGAAGNTWYKAGANVTKATSSAEISIKAAMVSNGSGQPKATTDYITITITGEDLVAALGSEETVVNNIALWNTVSGGEEQPVSVYIDSIEIKEKAEEPEPEIYTIHYDLRNDNATMETLTQSVVYGEDFQALLPQVDNDEFTGWKVVDTNEDFWSGTYLFEGNVYVYATWLSGCYSKIVR